MERAHEAFGDRTENQSFEPGAPVGGRNGQVSTLFFGQTGNFIAGMTDGDQGFPLNLFITHQLFQLMVGITDGLALLIHKKYGSVSICDAGRKINDMTHIKFGPKLLGQGNSPGHRMVGKV